MRPGVLSQLKTDRIMNGFSWFRKSIAFLSS